MAPSVSVVTGFNLLFTSGIRGGDSYNHPGGGASYLCLPNNPKYDKYKNGHEAAGYVYGTEYKVNDYNGDPFKRNLHNRDAQCVVCFVKSRGSMLMMPVLGMTVHLDGSRSIMGT